MEDNIFKPLTHMDREGYDENLTSRFQRRDTIPFEGNVFEDMDTGSISENEGWNSENQSDLQTENDDNIEANGCWCPSEAEDDGPVVYSETVIVEFYDDNEQ